MSAEELMLVLSANATFEELAAIQSVLIRVQKQKKRELEESGMLLKLTEDILSHMDRPAVAAEPEG